MLFRSAKPLEPIALACPGVTEIPQLSLSVLCCEAEDLTNNEHIFTIHPEGQLTLRSRCSGDALKLPGGTKSLKKLFIDRKIPANQRPNVPVLADDAGVLGVYGIGADCDRKANTLPAVTVTFESLKK